MSGSQCRARAASEALLGTFACSAAILMLMLVEMAAGLMPASSGSFSRLNLQKLDEHGWGFGAAESGRGSRG